MPPSVYRRVLHAHTLPSELRVLLNREWATVSVVSGLIVLLQGEASVGSTLTTADKPGFATVRWLFLAFNIVAYIGAVTSTLVSLFLLHTSNAVAQAELHAFLLSVTVLLWVPLVSLLVAVVAASFANVCATLLIYESRVAFGVRLGVALLWLVGLAFALRRLSKAAMAHIAPGLRDVAVVI